MWICLYMHGFTLRLYKYACMCEHICVLMYFDNHTFTLLYFYPCIWTYNFTYLCMNVCSVHTYAYIFMYVFIYIYICKSKFFYTAQFLHICTYAGFDIHHAFLCLCAYPCGCLPNYVATTQEYVHIHVVETFMYTCICSIDSRILVMFLCSRGTPLAQGLRKHMSWLPCASKCGVAPLQNVPLLPTAVQTCRALLVTGNQEIQSP